jgi:hypothetical protein
VATTTWELTGNLVRLTEEVNILGPNRDKSSDGSVGDLAHQGGRSGHNPDKTGNAEYKDGDSKNEVRAKDIDSSGPFQYGQTMEKIVQHLVMRGRRGDYLPLRYIIYKSRIWSKTDGWKTRIYTGQNTHDEHAHFSGDYTQKADTYRLFNYGIATLGKPTEDFMAFIDDQADFNRAMDEWANREVIPDYNPGNLDANGKPKRSLSLFTWTGWADGRAQKVINTLGLKMDQLGLKIDQFFAGEVARDAQDAARDAALMATITELSAALNNATGSKLTDAQFNDLKSAILEKVAEAGQDAADMAQAKLNQLAEALDNAAEALTGSATE